MRPVQSLVNQIQLILQEYLASGDVVEAQRCLRELEVRRRLSCFDVHYEKKNVLVK